MSAYEDGLAIWRSGQKTGTGNVQPIAPAVILHWPKYPHNVGQVVRLASAFGIKQVWYSGDRITDILDTHTRLPREERMKAYGGVTLINHQDPLSVYEQHFDFIQPVAVEVLEHSEKLPFFNHPDGLPNRAIYIFGPEDGSLPGSILKRCHRFVSIPSHQCLNLATSVACVLYDRMAKKPASVWPAIEGRGRS